MIVSLLRIIRYGVQGFLRNGWLSFSTVSIMILAALVFEGLILFNVVGKTAIDSIQDKIDISVYFKSSVSEDSILNIKKSLEGLTEVKAVQYVSRDQALEDFKVRHAGESVVTQTLEELDENPLLASLNVKAQDPREYETIAKHLSNQNLQEFIEKITYAQNQIVINRLVALVDALRQGGFLLTLFFAFLAAVVTFNTIRLAIFSDSEQIGIMRLVGASNGFIRGPYIVDGVLYGIIAGLVGFLIFIPLIGIGSPYVVKLIPEMNLQSFFNDSMFSFLFYQLLFGVGLGILSSVFAVRRYLRV